MEPIGKSNISISGCGKFNIANDGSFHNPTLDEVLAKRAPPPANFSAFVAFLSRLSCLENLEFFLDISRYRNEYNRVTFLSREINNNNSSNNNTKSDNNNENNNNNETILNQQKRLLILFWQRIINEYITPGSSREVNLPSEIIDSLLKLNNSFEFQLSKLFGQKYTIDNSTSNLEEFQTSSISHNLRLCNTKKNLLTPINNNIILPDPPSPSNFVEAEAIIRDLIYTSAFIPFLCQINSSTNKTTCHSSENVPFNHSNSHTNVSNSSSFQSIYSSSPFSINSGLSSDTDEISSSDNYQSKLHPYPSSSNKLTALSYLEAKSSTESSEFENLNTIGSNSGSLADDDMSDFSSCADLCSCNKTSYWSNLNTGSSDFISSYLPNKNISVSSLKTSFSNDPLLSPTANSIHSHASKNSFQFEQQQLPLFPITNADKCKTSNRLLTNPIQATGNGNFSVSSSLNANIKTEVSLDPISPDVPYMDAYFSDMTPPSTERTSTDDGDPKSVTSSCTQNSYFKSHLKNKPSSTSEDKVVSKAKSTMCNFFPQTNKSSNTFIEATTGNHSLCTKDELQSTLPAEFLTKQMGKSIKHSVLGASETEIKKLICEYKPGKENIQNGCFKTTTDKEDELNIDKISLSKLPSNGLKIDNPVDRRVKDNPLNINDSSKNCNRANQENFKLINNEKTSKPYLNENIFKNKNTKKIEKDIDSLIIKNEKRKKSNEDGYEIDDSEDEQVMTYDNDEGNEDNYYDHFIRKVKSNPISKSDNCKVSKEDYIGNRIGNFNNVLAGEGRNFLSLSPNQKHERGSFSSTLSSSNVILSKRFLFHGIKNNNTFEQNKNENEAVNEKHSFNYDHLNKSQFHLNLPKFSKIIGKLKNQSENPK